LLTNPQFSADLGHRRSRFHLEQLVPSALQ
jgi:hypothetical protein